MYRKENLTQMENMWEPLRPPDFCVPDATQWRNVQQHEIVGDAERAITHWTESKKRVKRIGKVGL